ncbi:MAG: SAM-dependent methyltransferase [Prevotella sp.]|nr:SAM-dependent methyltransferase [Prevotella sp.]
MSQQTNKHTEEQRQLPRFVREILNRHNIQLPSLSGKGLLSPGEGTRLRDRLLLQAHRYPDVDMPTLVDQLSGWQTACGKLPSWAANDSIIYPPHLSMEQCSSEQTATYKAQLAARLTDSSCSAVSSSSPVPLPPAVPVPLPQESMERLLVDLTGGFGVDFSFMARCFSHATYVERQEHLCALARHNFAALGLTQADVVNADSTDFLRSFSHAAMIFLDPARRDGHGGKTVLISDCTPDVLALEEELLAKADTVLLKLSPMLDWHRAVKELNRNGDVVREVHIVSVRNECKELLIVMRRNHDKCAEMMPVAPLRVFCMSDGDVVAYTVEEDTDIQLHILPSTPVAGQFLYEPNPSLMKAGCFSLLTARYPVSAVSANSHLFVADKEVDSFPGRSFVLTAVSSFNKKELRRTLAGISKANIAVRNFRMSVADLRRRLKIAEGGEVYLFATTDASGNHLLLVCRKM